VSKTGGVSFRKMYHIKSLEGRQESRGKKGVRERKVKKTTFEEWKGETRSTGAFAKMVKGKNRSKKNNGLPVEKIERAHGQGNHHLTCLTRIRHPSSPFNMSKRKKRVPEGAHSSREKIKY